MKIDLRISRKNVLLMNHVIERGLSDNEAKKDDDLLNSVAQENLEDLKVFAKDLSPKSRVNRTQ